MIANPVQCGPKPRLTPEQIVEAKRVKEARWRWSQRHGLPARLSDQPSTKTLAAQWGVSVDVVKRAMDARYFGWAYKHIGAA